MTDRLPGSSPLADTKTWGNGSGSGSSGICQSSQPAGENRSLPSTSTQTVSLHQLEVLFSFSRSRESATGIDRIVECDGEAYSSMTTLASLSRVQGERRPARRVREPLPPQIRNDSFLGCWSPVGVSERRLAQLTRQEAIYCPGRLHRTSVARKGIGVQIKAWRCSSEEVARA